MISIDYAIARLKSWVIDGSIRVDEDIVKFIIDNLEEKNFSWKSMDTAPKEAGTDFLAIVRGCESGKLKRVVLTVVDEPDCNWHFDGSEISNAWDALFWTKLPEFNGIPFLSCDFQGGK